MSIDSRRELISFTGGPAHEGDCEIMYRGKACEVDKPLLAAETPWNRMIGSTTSFYLFA